MKKILGIDIGGTKILSALTDEKGNLISEVQKYSTPKNKSEIENLLKNIANSYTDYNIVAIATAGAVNKENNKVISSTGNLCADYKEIEFKNIFSMPVYVENDANAAAWAEYEIGNAKGHSNTIILTLGTGVGGGIVVDRKLLKGKSGSAGEMHFKMRCDKHRKCTCGSYDCFEAYASGTGLAITASEIAQKPLTTYDVLSGVNANDDLCKKIFSKWQNDLICGIIGLANIFDPDSVILSGSMAEFVDCQMIENAVNNEIVTQPTKILHAKMKNNAGLIGAALLAAKVI